MTSDKDDLLGEYRFDYSKAKQNRFASNQHMTTATDVHVDTDTLTVTLEDGRQLRVPLSWYPRLEAGSEDERNNWGLLGDGYAIEWADLDEHIGVEGLLAGRKSQEVKRLLRSGWGLERSVRGRLELAEQNAA